jgi:hypothetical protein
LDRRERPFILADELAERAAVPLGKNLAGKSSTPGIQTAATCGSRSPVISPASTPAPAIRVARVPAE